MGRLRDAVAGGLDGVSAQGEGAAQPRLLGPADALTFADLATRTGLGAGIAALEGRSVLVRTRAQIAAAQALIELDGVARRLVLSPPDLAAEHLPAVIERAQIEAVVTDDEDVAALGLPVFRLAAPGALIATGRSEPRITEWLMFTSGTTGVPKMVIHTLAGLTGAIEIGAIQSRPQPKSPDTAPVVWGTFYDVRRYGGLQILLRALIGGRTLVLSDASEPTAAFLARLAAAGVTHQSGTPSHWRWALMNPELSLIAPRYVRLSGEIADQAVLDSLKAFFPQAAIGHAYASTEAGVGFEVTDGLEGFPASLIEPSPAMERSAVEMKIEDGSLRIRSARTASGYAGQEAALVDADGFVDTGDMVERRGERFYFTGRRGGVINIGGLKAHPEEIEAVLNRHPLVRMSLVRARRSPITGALVTADVVLEAAGRGEDPATLKADILAFCRETLAPYKTPASLKFVESLPVTAGGKLDRQHA